MLTCMSVCVCVCFLSVCYYCFFLIVVFIYSALQLQECLINLLVTRYSLWYIYATRTHNDRHFSVTQLLPELGLPGWNTLSIHSQSVFVKSCQNCKNSRISHICAC